MVFNFRLGVSSPRHLLIQGGGGTASILDIEIQDNLVSNIGCCLGTIYLLGLWTPHPRSSRPPPSQTVFIFPFLKTIGLKILSKLDKVCLRICSVCKSVTRHYTKCCLFAPVQKGGQPAKGSLCQKQKVACVSRSVPLVLPVATHVCSVYSLQTCYAGRGIFYCAI